MNRKAALAAQQTLLRIVQSPFRIILSVQLTYSLLLSLIASSVSAQMADAVGSRIIG